MIIISISNFEIKLIKYLQENGSFDLNLSESQFLKSSNTIRRNIQNINLYLPVEKQFLTDGNIITSKIQYPGFLEFLKTLELKDYSPTPEERILFLLITEFFSDFLNKSKAYTSIDVSLTTLKKDTLDLKSILKEHDLKMSVIPKKGVTIGGNELNYRILCSLQLMDLTELDNSGTLSQRKANTPMERVAACIALENINETLEEGNAILNNIFSDLGCKLSYRSKKFAAIYLAVSLYRMRKGYFIKKDLEISFKTLKITPFENPVENRIFSCFLSSLDFSKKSFMISDEELMHHTTEVISEIQKNIITEFHLKKEIFEEVYLFLYKNILRCKVGYSLKEDKLDNTHQIFENLFKISHASLKEVERAYDITFSTSQIAIFTLLLKMVITKSKVVGRNKKKIVIVSNYSVEKIDFFIETLKKYVEVDIVDCINIDELEKLNDITFDEAITFSNRIKYLLIEKNIPALKLSFYLEINHIKKLLDSGFSRAKRKILAKDIAPFLENKSCDKIEEILKNQFSDYFI